jgi:hypothetical protein
MRSLGTIFAAINAPPLQKSTKPKPQNKLNGEKLHWGKFRLSLAAKCGKIIEILRDQMKTSLSSRKKRGGIPLSKRHLGL